jgi:hypothetical protein
MAEKYTKGEMHGCIVCGKLYELYVVYNEHGKFIDCMVMTAGGRPVEHGHRALVACESHLPEQIEAAVIKVYRKQEEEDL